MRRVRRQRWVRYRSISGHASACPRYFLDTRQKEFLIRWMRHVWAMVTGQAFPRPRGVLRNRRRRGRRRPGCRGIQVHEDGHPELGSRAVGAHPQAQHLLAAVPLTPMTAYTGRFATCPSRTFTTVASTSSATRLANLATQDVRWARSAPSSGTARGPCLTPRRVRGRNRTARMATVGGWLI